MLKWKYLYIPIIYNSKNIIIYDTKNINSIKNVSISISINNIDFNNKNNILFIYKMPLFINSIINDIDTISLEITNYTNNNGMKCWFNDLKMIQQNVLLIILKS